MSDINILCGAHIADLHFGAMNPKLQYEILSEQFIDRIKYLPLDVVSINGETNTVIAA